MGKSIKVFIVEGESREKRLVSELTATFFSSDSIQIITLPAKQNLYMLYSLWEKDDFETDIIELLVDIIPEARDNLAGIDRWRVDEIYLFFDYDIHHNNYSTNRKDADDEKILLDMLNAFDNETENGKLYISYPMVEALYDYKRDMCEAYSNCYIYIDEVSDYKRLSGTDNPNSSRRLDYERWKEILNVFFLRVQCLFDMGEITFDDYRNSVTATAIYEKERWLKNNSNQVFVLSAFPEFILDYFKEDFWNSNVRLKRLRYNDCSKTYQ